MFLQGKKDSLEYFAMQCVIPKLHSNEHVNAKLTVNNRKVICHPNGDKMPSNT